MRGSPLFLLAVDHRRSFERLFGVAAPVDESARRRLTAAKVIVVDALTSVARERPEWSGLGVLVDDEYGGDAIAAARRANLTIAVAFERSGRDVLEFEHAGWRQRLDDLRQAALGGQGATPSTGRTTFAKVLVRHRADGDRAANAVQLERLREISEACAGSPVGFLLELLVPFTDGERSTHASSELAVSLRAQLIIAAVAEIQAAGVEADVWKVEGITDVGQCQTIAAQARAGGRDDVGVVVLGAGAEVETVDAWLRSAAAADYSGFAVGRSIWADALLDHDRGAVDAVTAGQRVASRYQSFVDTFLAARAV